MIEVIESSAGELAMTLCARAFGSCQCKRDLSALNTAAWISAERNWPIGTRDPDVHVPLNHGQSLWQPIAYFAQTCLCGFTELNRVDGRIRGQDSGTSAWSWQKYLKLSN